MPAAAAKPQILASFDNGGPLSELLMLGNIATQFPGETLSYDPVAGQITNHAEANQKAASSSTATAGGSERPTLAPSGLKVLSGLRVVSDLDRTFHGQAGMGSAAWLSPAVPRRRRMRTNDPVEEPTNEPVELAEATCRVGSRRSRSVRSAVALRVLVGLGPWPPWPPSRGGRWIAWTRGSIPPTPAGSSSRPPAGRSGWSA